MTTDLARSDSQRVVHRRYDAYGLQWADDRGLNSLEGTNDLATDHRFTGQKADGTGLMYYNARYYDPEIGQFISPDSVVPDPGNVFAYNRYMYVYGNPILFEDTNGREPIPFWRRWFGASRLSSQWYRFDANTFNSAAQHNTATLNADAYQSIYQRHSYYKWMQSTLDVRGSDSKWFGAAKIVTNWNGLGGAELPNGFVISPEVENFLIDGNVFLFSHNIKNAKGLLDNGSLEGSFIDPNGTTFSFNGLTGKDLDYVLVNFEQSKVQEFINSYDQNIGSQEMASIILGVNELFTFPLNVFGRSVAGVMNEHFDGGESFDFGNYDHRVILGQRLIDIVHE